MTPEPGLLIFKGGLCKKLFRDFAARRFIGVSVSQDAFCFGKRPCFLFVFVCRSFHTFLRSSAAFMEPILTWRPIVPLSRLTYCAFLAHGGLQLYSVASSGNPFYGSVYNLVSYFFIFVLLFLFFRMENLILSQFQYLGLTKYFLNVKKLH